MSETFKVMEHRLLTAIMNPAMVVVWVTGLRLALAGRPSPDGWLHAKLALVVLLSGFHGCSRPLAQDFAADRNTRPAKFYRIANEVPTVLMIGS